MGSQRNIDLTLHFVFSSRTMCQICLTGNLRFERASDATRIFPDLVPEWNGN